MAIQRGNAVCVMNCPKNKSTGLESLLNFQVGTIHLIRRQIFAIFDPYPPPVGNHRHSSKIPPPSKKDIGI